MTDQFAHQTHKAIADIVIITDTSSTFSFAYLALARVDACGLSVQTQQPAAESDSAIVSQQQLAKLI
jgi:hypothetical protein